MKTLHAPRLYGVNYDDENHVHPQDHNFRQRQVMIEATLENYEKSGALRRAREGEMTREWQGGNMGAGNKNRYPQLPYI